MNRQTNISSQKKVDDPRNHTCSCVGWFKSEDQIPLLKTRTYPQNKEREQVNTLIILNILYLSTECSFSSRHLSDILDL